MTDEFVVEQGGSTITEYLLALHTGYKVALLIIERGVEEPRA